MLPSRNVAAPPTCRRAAPPASERCEHGGMTTRVAMWSGPRNISTAMMRSFGSRADTVVVDEPLYAHYLAVTGLDHPGRDAVLASQPNRWQDVAAALTGPPPAGAAVHYQKHVAHHLLPDMGRS